MGNQMVQWPARDTLQTKKAATKNECSKQKRSAANRKRTLQTKKETAANKRGNRFKRKRLVSCKQKRKPLQTKEGTAANQKGKTAKRGRGAAEFLNLNAAL